MTSAFISKVVNAMLSVPEFEFIRGQMAAEDRRKSAVKQQAVANGAGAMTPKQLDAAQYSRRVMKTAEELHVEHYALASQVHALDRQVSRLEVARAAPTTTREQAQQAVAMVDRYRRDGRTISYDQALTDVKRHPNTRS